MYEESRSYNVTPFVGRPLAVTVVAVVAPEEYRFDAPAVVPSQSLYCVTPMPAVHVNVGLEPVNTLPGVGEVRTAGVGVASVYV